MSWLLLLAIMLAAGCQREPKQPDTPEMVIRKYQDHYDNNRFAEAALLSTERERERLEDLRIIIESEPPDSTIFTTTFLSINCTTEQDTAICICQVQDIDLPYTREYRLIRVNGQWLVDAPDEEIEIEEDFMEDMLDSLDFDVESGER